MSDDFNRRYPKSNTVWEFKDSAGVARRGYFSGFSDFGGTDVPYYFRDVETDRLYVVSGQRLKEAKVIHENGN
jgi:hypothetical protein